MSDKNSGKAYELGLMVGRFQMLHAGHIDMIEQALCVCDKVGIFVGSSQESGTAKNPFSYELRKEMLERIFGEAIIVKPLPDIGVGNNSRWGDYVLKMTLESFGRLPDIVVSGKEARRSTWYDGEAGEKIAELMVPKRIGISATEMRDFLTEGREEEWKKYADERLHPMYEKLREAMLASRDRTDTASI